MGGKGKRRREKNFLAAHGGYTRLPPPPKSNDLDVLPSKLHKLMDFMSTPKITPAKKQQGHLGASLDTQIGKKRESPNIKNKYASSSMEFKEESACDNGKKMLIRESGDTSTNPIKTGKRKKKKKSIDDLHFQKIIMDSATSGLSSKRQRRKKFLKERKKKHKKGKIDDTRDLPMHEKVSFGEVVEAPPKIASFPKGTKTILGASQERLRLKAVEAYRERKGWASRPGIRLPPVTVELET